MVKKNGGGGGGDGGVIILNFFRETWNCVKKKKTQRLATWNDTVNVFLRIHLH